MLSRPPRGAPTALGAVAALAAVALLPPRPAIFGLPSSWSGYLGGHGRSDVLQPALPPLPPSSPPPPARPPPPPMWPPPPSPLPPPNALLVELAWPYPTLREFLSMTVLFFCLAVLLCHSLLACHGRPKLLVVDAAPPPLRHISPRDEHERVVDARPPTASGATLSVAQRQPPPRPRPSQDTDAEAPPPRPSSPRPDERTRSPPLLLGQPRSPAILADESERSDGSSERPTESERERVFLPLSSQSFEC